MRTRAFSRCHLRRARCSSRPHQQWATRMARPCCWYPSSQAPLSARPTERGRDVELGLALVIREAAGITQFLDEPADWKRSLTVDRGELARASVTVRHYGGGDDELLSPVVGRREFTIRVLDFYF